MAANVEFMPPARLLSPVSPLKTTLPNHDALSIDIRDIRTPDVSLDLSSSIRSGLTNPKSENTRRSLPSILLWDEAGLKYFEEITYTPEYYLTDTEIGLLERHALQLGRQLAPGTILLELGSGNLRKTNILLEALEKLAINIDYYALDLDKKELVRTLRQLRPSRFKHIRVHGLWGTYDDGRAWIARKENQVRPKCILSLGSTIGCMSREDAGGFCREWATTIKQSTPDSLTNQNRILLGLDNNQEPQKILQAYCDSHGANKRFILNALRHANSCLGYEAFEPADWTVHGVWNDREQRHEQHLVPLTPVNFEGTALAQGEHVLVANSYKYSEADVHRLASDAALQCLDAYQTDDKTYGLCFEFF